MNALTASYCQLRLFLSARVAGLREARADGDRGASAVELAIITAVILVIAGIILAAITQFVNTQSDTIRGNGG
jgi:Flp pilus assembly protein TadG